jgi:hypothetical protein
MIGQAGSVQGLADARYDLALLELGDVKVFTGA